MPRRPARWRRPPAARRGGQRGPRSAGTRSSWPRRLEGDPLLGWLPPRFDAFQWHSYEAPLPPGGTPLAHSDVCLQAFALDGRAWGIQFHAEVSAESVGQWLDTYDKDEDAVRIGLDPEALRAESAGRIDAWNDLGRDICRRFLAVAA